VRSAASRTRPLFCGLCFVGVRLGEYVRVSLEMTGRCLLCNFDLGVDANGVQRTGSHTQRTCGLKSMPCRHALSVGHPFRKDGAFFEVDCCHHTKCTKCPVVGHHVSTLVLSPDRFQMDNKTGNVTRRRTAPPLSSSDYVCPLVTDAVVAEWVRAHHAACWADWRQSQEAAAAAADIVANIHQSGMRTVAAADFMAGTGIVAASNNADKRPVFQAMAIALDDPDQTAVEAALAAAASATMAATGGGVGRGVRRGRGAAGSGGRGRAALGHGDGRGRTPRGGGLGGAADSGSTIGSAGRGMGSAAGSVGMAAAAGTRTSRGVLAAEETPGRRNVQARSMNSLDLPSVVDRRASTTGTGGGGGRRVGSREASPPTDNAARAGGPSDLPARSAAQMARAHVTLMQSNALRAADSVSRLTATGSGSTELVAVVAAARARAKDAGGPAVAVAVVAAPLHLT